MPRTTSRAVNARNRPTLAEMEIEQIRGLIGESVSLGDFGTVRDVANYLADQLESVRGQFHDLAAYQEELRKQLESLCATRITVWWSPV